MQSQQNRDFMFDAIDETPENMKIHRGASNDYEVDAI
jgi:hypothetical protein